MTAPRSGDAARTADLRLRLGVGSLLFLLAIFALLSLAPRAPGAVRILGVSLGWWYAGALAPLLAVLITVGCLRPAASAVTDWPGVGGFSLWITPVLLFSIPAALLNNGREGLWIALLVVVAPLLGFVLSSPRPDVEPPHPALTLALALMGFILLWANSLLAGDIARRLGTSRLAGILTAAGAMFIVTAWPRYRRWEPALVPLALLFLLASVWIVGGRAERWPLAAWSHAASLPAFRFAPDSPWVTEGRSVALRRGADSLLFEEEHRIATVAPGPLRILVSDLGRVQVQEWTLAAGQSVTVRPGDRLAVEPGVALRFEANKRIPDSPRSGLSWADPPPPSLGTELFRFLGVGFTVLGGATALLASERTRALARGQGAISGVGYLLAVAWALGWATYAAVLAPELFLGGVTPDELFELPALALRGTRWGPWLGWLLILGGFASLLASAAALRDLLTRRALEGRDLGFWAGMLGVAVLGSLWPLDPWSVLLIAFGLGASTLAPLRWVGIREARPRAISVAVGGGLCVFLALAAARQLVTAPGPWAQTLLTYPALVAGPVTVVLLRLSRRFAG